MAGLHTAIFTSERIWGLLLLEVWSATGVSEGAVRMRWIWTYPVDILIGHFDITSFAMYTTRDGLLARKTYNKGIRPDLVESTTNAACSGTAMVEAMRDEKNGRTYFCELIWNLIPTSFVSSSIYS